MRTIVGVQLSGGGTMQVLGVPAGSPELRSRIGYVSQSPSVYGDLSVAANLRYFASILLPGDRELARARCEEALEAVDLTPLADRRVDTLSGGEASRASLAVALLGDPDLLVLDEPTVGLDPVLRRDLWAFFDELAGRGITLLVSSHVMDEAERCDDLLLMRNGTILFHGATPDLLVTTGQPDVESAFLNLVEGS